MLPMASQLKASKLIGLLYLIESLTSKTKGKTIEPAAYMPADNPILIYKGITD